MPFIANMQTNIVNKVAIKKGDSFFFVVAFPVYTVFVSEVGGEPPEVNL